VDDGILSAYPEEMRELSSPLAGGFHYRSVGLVKHVGMATFEFCYMHEEGETISPKN
jgi:hypothetical protein